MTFLQLLCSGWLSSILSDCYRCRWCVSRNSNPQTIGPQSCYFLDLVVPFIVVDTMQSNMWTNRPWWKLLCLLQYFHYSPWEKLSHVGRPTLESEFSSVRDCEQDSSHLIPVLLWVDYSLTSLMEPWRKVKVKPWHFCKHKHFRRYIFVLSDGPQLPFHTCKPLFDAAVTEGEVCMCESVLGVFPHSSLKAD